MPTKIPNYHFAQNADGTLAIQADEPAPGIVTFTWRPNEFPGTAVEAAIPQDLFVKVATGYVQEHIENRSAKKG